MSLNSNEFTHDVVVQDEIDRMKAAAPDYRIGTTCEFRTIISNACRDTYFGRRSIANFAEVAVPMIKQQQEFEAFEIPVRLLMVRFDDEKISSFEVRSLDTTSVFDSLCIVHTPFVA